MTLVRNLIWTVRRTKTESYSLTSPYSETYLFSHPTLPFPILGREPARLLPHCGGGWVGVSSYSETLDRRLRTTDTHNWYTQCNL